MIVLFTDFGVNGPYVGQLKSAILNLNPESKIIDLMHDAPTHDVKHSACLLKSLVEYFPNNSIFCCVVDPGVGSSRKAIAARINNNYFIGPDNGLFEYLIRTSDDIQVYKIIWKPEDLSMTFHGRDLFAPIAAKMEQGDYSGVSEIDLKDLMRFSWTDNLWEIIYIDGFGNLMTGVMKEAVSENTVLEFMKKKITHVRNYSEMKEGKLYWYFNSNGLVEISMKEKSAQVAMGAQIGESVRIAD